ncbi:hypothetical protein D0T50_12750 [Bacteroides sp. 214]|uniref:hypothetical protein n=1 Tax=Bacteroides sp. 214 TaxID=2302935 RepID=UPI0013D2F420|nr:hypothetical protein [Bacteroides sp. 214]NDW13752.1 hypothetical protein [Bacteroides sp. 214]
MRNTSIAFFTLCLCLVCSYCTKEIEIYEEFKKPESKILSIEKTNGSDYQITTQIKNGVGATLNSCYFEIEDITIPNTIRTKIEANKEKKEFSTTALVTLTEKHDYRIQIVLETEKNKYKSEITFLYLSEDYTFNSLSDILFPYIGEFYRDTPNEIGLTLNSGKGGLIDFHFQQLPSKPLPLVIKVNGKKILETTMEFEHWIYNTQYQEYIKSVYTEFINIPPGDYPIFITLADTEYQMKEKIRILDNNIRYFNLPLAYSQWNSTAFSYVYSNRPFYFLQKNKQTYLATSLDVEKGEWKLESEITLPYENSYFLPKSTQLNNDLYMLVRKDSICYIKDEIWPEKMFVLDIWKYNNTSFVKETSYPGKANQDIIFFTDGKNLYAGGGYIYTSNLVGQSDFWCYNLDAKEWKKRNDIPITFNNPLGTSSVLIDNEIYIFTNYRELWKYSPSSDNWTHVSTLKGGGYYRNNSTLLYCKGSLYVLGGTFIPGANLYEEDVWVYNIQNNRWMLKSFFDRGYYNFPAFVRNDKIYATNHLIFENLKFIEIQ